MSLLEINSLTKTYGGLVAVDNCSFDLAEETLTGLIGPNGAGKTTLFNLISGIEAPDEGDIVLNGDVITDSSPNRICQRGIARSFQVPREWSQMTVMENLLLAAQNHPGESPLRSLLKDTTVQEAEEEFIDQASEILELVDLYEKRNQLTADLSVGQKKLLEIGRCLMIDPQLLLLDEPFAGVNPALIPDLIDYLEEIHERGLTILVIEHNIEDLAKLVEEILVMNNGNIIVRGQPDEVRQDEQVRELYLGGA